MAVAATMHAIRICSFFFISAPCPRLAIAHRTKRKLVLACLPRTAFRCTLAGAKAVVSLHFGVILPSAVCYAVPYIDIGSRG
jgi:hypothetical protein